MNYIWDFINNIGNDYIDFSILSFLSVIVIRLEFRFIVSNRFLLNLIL